MTKRIFKESLICSEELFPSMSSSDFHEKLLCDYLAFSLKYFDDTVEKTLENFFKAFYSGSLVLFKVFKTFESNFLKKIIFIFSFEQMFLLDNISNAFDIYQLLKLLCPDFPIRFVLRSCEIAGKLAPQNEDDLNKLKIHENFLQVFKFYFLFDKFSEQILSNKSFEFEKLLSLDFEIKIPEYLKFKAALEISNQGFKESDEFVIFESSMLKTLNNEKLDSLLFLNSISFLPETQIMLKNLKDFISKDERRIKKLLMKMK